MQSRIVTTQFYVAITLFLQATFAMKYTLKRFLYILTLFFFNSCALNRTYIHKKQCKPEYFESYRMEAENHWLYRCIPKKRNHICWYDAVGWGTWMLFGNDDDGIFGEATEIPFKMGAPADIAKATAWWIRNPLHNFCFYVIGTAHRQNSEVTILKIASNQLCFFHYRNHASTVFASEQTCFYIALHGGKPFVSLRIAYNDKYRSDFYIGWRCRGNFGIKCLPLTTRKTS